MSIRKPAQCGPNTAGFKGAEVPRRLVSRAGETAEWTKLCRSDDMAQFLEHTAEEENGFPHAVL